MQNRIISSDKGMDAIDAMLCLGYKIIKYEYCMQGCKLSEEYKLIPTTFAPLYSPCGVEAVALRSICAEITDRPEHHKMLIQQKGMAQ